MIDLVSNIQLGDFFSDLVNAVSETSHIKKPVKEYITGVLISQLRLDEVFNKVDNSSLFRSLGSQYLELQKAKRKAEEYQELGDTCLALVGLFREFVKARGISILYYCDIGRGSYQQVANLSKMPLSGVFMDLAYDFDDIADLLYTIGIKVLPKNTVNKHYLIGVA